MTSSTVYGVNWCSFSQVIKISFHDLESSLSDLKLDKLTIFAAMRLSLILHHLYIWVL